MTNIQRNRLVVRLAIVIVAFILGMLYGWSTNTSYKKRLEVTGKALQKAGVLEIIEVPPMAVTNSTYHPNWMGHNITNCGTVSMVVITNYVSVTNGSALLNNSSK